MKRLRIGIDINEANVKNRVGTGQYTYHILQHCSARTDLDFHLYYRDPLQGALPPEDAHWQYHQVGPTKGWIRFGLPLYLATHAPHDVWWSPAHYMPVVTRAERCVVTIHDLAYEYFPDLFLPSDLYKLKHWSRAAVRQADHVIAVSAATRHDLVALYNVPTEKVSVIHNGYDSDIFNLSTPADKSLIGHWSLDIVYLSNVLSPAR